MAGLMSKGTVSGIMAIESGISAGTEGAFLPVEFLTGALLGSIMLAKKIKNKVHDKREGER
jgi:H+/Cl- antiporter ClcA